MVRCSDCSIRNLGLQKLALGPAYNQWAANTLQLESSYEEQWPLYPAWMNDCCRHATMDLTKHSNWRGQIALMVAFISFFAAGMALFFVNRKNELLKFRGFGNVLLFGISCTILVVFSILEYMADGSFPLKIQAYVLFGTITYLALPYIVKAVQMLFVYHWNRVKVNRTNTSTYKILKRFKTFSFVLQPSFYVGACATGLLLLGVAPAAIVTQGSIWSDPGGVEYSSVRCNWFYIPDEYTNATSNSSACSCVNSYYLKEESYNSECEVVLQSCQISNLTGVDAEYCNRCASSAGYDQNCTSWLYDTFTSGECGFPSRVPDFSSCLSGVSADSSGLTMLISVSSLLGVMNLLLIVPLARMKDYFGMTSELLCRLFFGYFPYFILFNLLPSIWPYSYPSDLFVGVLCAWIMVSIHVFFPIVLLWKRKGKGPSIPDREQSNTDSRPRQTHSSQSNGDFYELDRCLETPALLAVYETFTVEEFTAENVRFLVECKTFFSIADEPKLLEEARNLMFNFVQAGAVLQVNLSHKTRVNITTTFENWTRSSAPNSGAPVPSSSTAPLSLSAPAEETLKAYGRAYDEIRYLIARSSWPSFKKSQLFLKYKAVEEQLEDEQAVEKQVNTWYTNDLGRAPDTEGRDGSNRKQPQGVHAPWKMIAARGVEADTRTDATDSPTFTPL